MRSKKQKKKEIGKKEQMSSQKWEKCHRKQTKCWTNDFERSTRRVPVTRWEKTATSMLSIFYEQECYDFVSNSKSNKWKELQRRKEAAKLQKSSYELEDWKRWETICFGCDKVFSASKSFFVCSSFKEWKKEGSSILQRFSFHIRCRFCVDVQQ